MTVDASLLRQRLLDAPHDLLHAISSASASALLAFDEQWATLRQDVDKAVQLSLLDGEALTLAQTQASSIATISFSFTSIEQETAQLSSACLGEVETILSQLSLDDVDLPCTAAFPPSRDRVSSQPYISTAYRWLLRNIHDPYPSSENKKEISKEAGISVGAVSDWFKRARREIGWMTLCKEHFQGSRALAVAAARHFFIEDDRTSSLPADVQSAFKRMQTRVQTLYSLDDEDDNISTNQCAPSFPASVPRRSPSVTSLVSWSSSATPSLYFSEDEEWSPFSSSDTPSGPSSLGKRRSSHDSIPLRRAKRLRPNCTKTGTCSADVADSSSVLINAGDAISTPPSRKRRLSETTPGPAGDPVGLRGSSLEQSIRVLPKRSRRMSASDSQSEAKRPSCSLLTGPRKHAVSDPMPFNTAQSLMDQWFDETFNPFEAPTLDPVSVELCTDWNTFDALPETFYTDLMDPTLSFMNSLLNDSATDALEVNNSDLNSFLASSDNLDILSSADSFCWQANEIPSLNVSDPMVLALPGAESLAPTDANIPSEDVASQDSITFDPDTLSFLEALLAESNVSKDSPALESFASDSLTPVVDAELAVELS